MLKGGCHCGSVRWTLDAEPLSITACNCSICSRFGALWAYGAIGHDIQTFGQTGIYRRDNGGDIDFHFCSNCGCVTHYVATAKDDSGRYRSAVNVRMSNPVLIGDIPIRRFDGCGRFRELPRDGRTVKDMWF